MSKSLRGKTAIVTGACNGIGRAIARDLSQAGANVVMAGVSEKVLEEAAERLGGTEAGVLTFTGDFSQKLAIANLMAATIGAFDRIDILVNATHYVKFSDPLTTNGDVLEELLERNVTGTFRLSRRVARRMIKQHEEDESDEAAGTIVNISAIGSECLQEQLTSYAISCAALDQMTRSLARTLAPHRIQVNAIAMGMTVNPCLHTALQACEDKEGELAELAATSWAGNADEAAEAALVLLANEDAENTGQIVEIKASQQEPDTTDLPTY